MRRLFQFSPDVGILLKSMQDYIPELMTGSRQVQCITHQHRDGLPGHIILTLCSGIRFLLLLLEKGISKGRCFEKINFANLV